MPLNPIPMSIRLAGSGLTADGVETLIGAGPPFGFVTVPVVGTGMALAPPVGGSASGSRVAMRAGVSFAGPVAVVGTVAGAVTGAGPVAMRGGG
jgi:hypothetical protein